MRILLVEDHEDSRQAMAALLRISGHEVVHVGKRLAERLVARAPAGVYPPVNLRPVPTARTTTL